MNYRHVKFNLHNNQRSRERASSAITVFCKTHKTHKDFRRTDLALIDWVNTNNENTKRMTNAKVIPPLTPVTESKIVKRV